MINESRHGKPEHLSGKPLGPWLRERWVERQRHPISEGRTVLAAELSTWTSGWFWISGYGNESPGFAQLTISDSAAAFATIHWFTPIGEQQASFRLRHDAALHRVELYVRFDDSAGNEALDEDEADGDFEPETIDPAAGEPAWSARGWSVESTHDVEPGVVELYVDERRIQADELFTRLAATQKDMFQLLLHDHKEDLVWEPPAEAPPSASLWRPADVIAGLPAFSTHTTN